MVVLPDMLVAHGPLMIALGDGAEIILPDRANMFILSRDPGAE
jgi:hypothetical protein